MPRLVAPLLLLFALMCAGLGVSGQALAHAGCPHGMERGAPGAAPQANAQPAVAGGGNATVAPLWTSRSPSRTGRPPLIFDARHVGGALAPVPACCTGSGCLMACAWVVAALDLVPQPTGPGRRLAFAPAAWRPSRTPAVPLPPPRSLA